MELQGNAIYITGSGSGIGRVLAEAFHRLGNQVIIAGRRQTVLERVTAANPGMKAVALNVEEPETIKAFGRRIAEESLSIQITRPIHKNYHHEKPFFRPPAPLARCPTHKPVKLSHLFSKILTKSPDCSTWNN